MVETHLSNLKQQLQQQKMSLLVGSGFSKNASPLFPSWDELLEDLTYELYRFEIDHSYALAKASLRGKKGYGAFATEKTREILQREGYLEVASAYIRKYSAESLADYIEQRTPSIIPNHDGPVLKLGESMFPLNEADLAQHHQWIRLPWNNIYTTNYDQLLEQCIDEGEYASIEKSISELEEARKLTKDHIERVSEQLSNEEERLASFLQQPGDGSPYSENSRPAIRIQDPKTTINDELQTLLDSLKGKIREYEHQLIGLEEERDDRTQEINAKYAMLSETFCVVRSATQLQLKKHKNIIKLHGSIRSQEDKDRQLFEFDSDHRKHYVIAKEDYDTYPSRHEAFTQLMRISLLQESFCLVGFSGTDPNFQAWVNWVEDLLKRRQPLSGKGQTKKIYLISVGSEPASTAQELFYSNHSIARISITSPQSIAFLERETGETLPASTGKTAFLKSVFSLLSSYLAGHGPMLVSPKEINAEENRRLAWQQLAEFFRIDANFDTQRLQSAIRSIEDGYHRQRLPILFQRSVYRQQDLLSKQRDWMAKTQKGDTNRSLILSLLLHAVEDLKVPLGYGLDLEYVEEAQTIPELQLRIQRLIAREQALQPLNGSFPNPTKLNPEDQALALAFSFQFDALGKLLATWNAQPEQILIKGGLTMFLDPKAARDVLKTHLHSKSAASAELQLYTYEMLQYTNVTLNYQRDKQVDRHIEQLTKTGLKPLSEHFELIEKHIKLAQATDVPYGKVRYIGPIPERFFSSAPLDKALQYLTYLSSAGFLVHNRNTQFRTHKEWYPIVLLGFERYPEAFLFYSLQIPEKDFLRQLGRDYAYSSTINQRLASICQSLLGNRDAMPKTFRENADIFLAEILVAVPPSFWENELFALWEVRQDRQVDDPEIKNETQKLIAKGLRYLADQHILSELLHRSLEPEQDHEKKIASVETLYHLNSNRHFKTMISDPALSLAENERIHALIHTLEVEYDTHLFLLANIRPLLSVDHLQQIRQKLQLTNLSNASIRALRLVYNFGGQDPMISKKLKKAIKAHAGIWYTGITGRSFSPHIETLDLTDFSKKESKKKGITWTLSELRKFYGKLKIALDGIEQALAVRGTFFEVVAPEVTPVLNEAEAFLDLFSAKLEAESDFQAVNAQLQKLIRLARGFNTLTQGLSSADEQKARQAIHALAKQFYRNRAQKHQIDLLLHKIQLQQGPELELSLGYLPYCFGQTERFKANVEHIPQLLAILERYLEPISQPLELPKVFQSCLELAIVLKNNGQQDSVIDCWMERGRTSVFNNVRDVYQFRDRQTH